MNRFNKPVFNGISTKHERKNKEKMLELFHKPVKSGIKKIPYGWGEIVFINEYNTMSNELLSTIERLTKNLTH